MSFTVAGHVFGEAPDKVVAVSLWQETARFVDAHRDHFDRHERTSVAVFDDLFQAMRDFEPVYRSSSSGLSSRDA